LSIDSIEVQGIFEKIISNNDLVNCLI